MGDDAPKPPDLADDEKILWVADSTTQIHPVKVKLGITDSINTVLLESEEPLEGLNVATGKMSAAAALKTEGQTSNPFMPKPPARDKKDPGRGGPGGPPPGP